MLIHELSLILFQLTPTECLQLAPPEPRVDALIPRPDVIDKRMLQSLHQPPCNQYVDLFIVWVRGDAPSPLHYPRLPNLPFQDARASRFPPRGCASSREQRIFSSLANETKKQPTTSIHWVFFSFHSFLWRIFVFYLILLFWMLLLAL